MAKKPRTTTAPTASTPVPQKDVLQRLSYMYQASALLANGVDRRPTKRRRTAHERARPRATTAAGHDDNFGCMVPTQPPVEAQDGCTSEYDEDQFDKERLNVKQVIGPEGKLCLALDWSENLSRIGSHARPTHSSTPPPSAQFLLSQSLVKTMKDVGKKATLRMDPNVKRTMCKSCDALLIPGVTASVRNKRNGPHRHVMTLRCTACCSARRIPAPPESLPPPPLSQALNDDDAMDIETGAMDSVAKGSRITINSKRKPSRRDRKERRATRKKPVFFQQSDHVVVAGDRVVQRDQ
ncbi:hypothetical protein ACM66B_000073 [Microbotryomycetes sp. NB124-2]